MSLTIKVPTKFSSAVDGMINGNSIDAVMRIAAVTMGAVVTRRIHEQGKKADGAEIGTYSPQYIKRRQRNKWGTSSKVILEFTGQMRQDFSVVSQNPEKVKGGYALGFSNSFNEAKAGWNEKRYGKVYALTPEEKTQLKEVIQYEVNRLFK